MYCASGHTPAPYLLLLYRAAAAFTFLSAGRQNTDEISYQHFKNKLLANNLVTKLEVVNRSYVRVYTRTGAASSLASESSTEVSAAESGSGSAAGNASRGSSAAGDQGAYRYYFTIGSVDSFERKLEDAFDELGFDPREHVPVRYTSELNIANEIGRFLPTILLIAGYLYFTRAQMGGGGFGGMNRGGGGQNSIFNVGKANITYLNKNQKKVLFKDVAGCDEAKQEIMEFVDFLKNPKRYEDIGAKIPRGALLVGPPGTGKTLLAKATAGEANVPFLSISGSDFMEMFVGVGSSRVRDLFSQAKQQQPSIIFVDEIDAIGRARGRGGMGGNDERENTLNQLLVEMDGFATSQSVVVLAGTNRPDVLDNALLRPGRFDRQVTIDRPDVKGRNQIFDVYLRNIKLMDGMGSEDTAQRLAALTPGFTGADISNCVNEAALVAARNHKNEVDMTDFESAIDRVIGGLEKKSRVISQEERKTVAYHEAGHAVVSWFLQHAEPLLKVSIVPRGSAALGFAQYLPNENQLMTTEQMRDMICMALGGRASEQVVIGSISTGAQNDLQRVTQMTYSMIGVYGMGKNVGLLSFPPDEQRLDKPYSQETAKMLDEEAKEFVGDMYARTLQLVEEKRELIHNLAQALLEKEVVQLEDLTRILGERPYKGKALENIDRYVHGIQAESKSGMIDEGSSGTGGGDESGGSDGGRGDDSEGEPGAPVGQPVDQPGRVGPTPQPTPAASAVGREESGKRDRSR